MKYLNLIRYPNLLLIALMQLVVYYGFLNFQNIPLVLQPWQYFLLILATVCITAGGYIINDIFDQEADAINKPEKKIVGTSITESQAYNLYVGFTLTGVGIGFYLSRLIEHPNFVIVFILCSASLYLYATSWKGILLVKNIIVSLLLAFSILIIGLFVLFPAITPYNKPQLLTAFSVLFDFSIIAFVINFLRELVKDLEDVKGDYNQGIQTLPIVLGINRTAKIVCGLTFIPIGMLLYYTYVNLFELLYATLYILLAIIGPLLYFSIKMAWASQKKEFKHLSQVLRLVIFLGILAIGVIGLNMYYYATQQV
ncbi:geranylgeranylglycerol-phosphate geranylgeranyltransferase [Flavobacterium sp.]|uniref:geranylgeranylglycerol-phosphate geranylgeranyltransferase n=1 Tax=Flavobacterium sp. TaxID=239 RepID=UPI003D0A22C1